MKVTIDVPEKISKNFTKDFIEKNISDILSYRKIKKNCEAIQASPISQLPSLIFHEVDILFELELRKDCEEARSTKESELFNL